MLRRMSRRGVRLAQMVGICVGPFVATVAQLCRMAWTARTPAVASRRSLPVLQHTYRTFRSALPFDALPSSISRGRHLRRAKKTRSNTLRSSDKPWFELSRPLSFCMNPIAKSYISRGASAVNCNAGGPRGGELARLPTAMAAPVREGGVTAEH
eukprot:350436-Chlamydomonas_euryale.AAC.8